MPVVAVAAAAASFAAGATAFAAATTLAASVAAGAMMVGGALTVVGTITGNQKLARIGGVMALAGGLGTMAANAAAGADALASTGGQMGDAGAAVSSGAGEAAAGAVTSGIDAASAATSGVEVGGVNLSGTENFALEPVGATAEVGSSGSAIAPLQSATPAADALASTGGQMADAGMQVSGTGTLNSANTQVGQVAQQTGAEVAGAASKVDAFNQGWISAEGGQGYSNGMAMDIKPPLGANDPGMFAKFQAWTKENPQMAKMLMEGGKGMLGSLVSSPKDQAMIDYYKQNAETLKRRALWGSGRTIA